MRGYRRGSEDLSDTGKRKAPRLEHTFETDNDKNMKLTGSGKKKRRSYEACDYAGLTLQRIESEACGETRKKNIGLVEIYHTAEKYDLVGLLAGLRAGN